jgi:hypothetical protein
LAKFLKWPPVLSCVNILFGFLQEIEGEGVLAESYEEIVNKPVAEQDIAASFASLREMLARD